MTLKALKFGQNAKGYACRLAESRERVSLVTVKTGRISNGELRGTGRLQGAEDWAPTGPLTAGK